MKNNWIDDSKRYAIWHTHSLIAIWFAWTPRSLLTSQREGGCAHRSRVSAHERRWLYFWGIQVRESAQASGARPPPSSERIFTHKPLPCPLHPSLVPRSALSVSLAGLELCLLPLKPLQLISNTDTGMANKTESRHNNVSRIWTSASVKHKIFGFRYWDVLDATRVGLYVRVCAWHFVVSFEKQEFFRS